MTDTPTKPKAKPAGKKAEALTPDEQKRRFGEVCEALGTNAATKPSPKPPGKLGAEKLTPEEQRRRFIEAAREAGASEDEAEFDTALRRIVAAKPARTDKS